MPVIQKKCRQCHGSAVCLSCKAGAELKRERDEAFALLRTAQPWLAEDLRQQIHKLLTGEK